MILNVEFVRDIEWHALERLQEKYAARVREDSRYGVLLFSVPRPVLTAGRSAGVEELLLDASVIRARGIEVVSVDRGGKWTYHGPGQLLCYPIVSLRSFPGDRYGIRQFLEIFRTGIHEWLRGKGVQSVCKGEPFGLFVDHKKIVSFGISVRRAVVCHGAAIALWPDSLGFSFIHPCGVPGQQVTSLAELGCAIDPEEATSELAALLKKSFISPEKVLV